MTSKDFRIGNYILYDGKLDRIDSRYALAFENEFMDGIEPIELTEQWLVDFGFTKDKETDYRWFFGDWLAYDLDDNGIRISDSWEFGNRKYVHELQNLVFALTDQELELVAETST